MTWHGSAQEKFQDHACDWRLARWTSPRLACGLRWWWTTMVWVTKMVGSVGRSKLDLPIDHYSTMQAWVQAAFAAVRASDASRSLLPIHPSLLPWVLGWCFIQLQFVAAVIRGLCLSRPRPRARPWSISPFIQLQCGWPRPLLIIYTQTPTIAGSFISFPSRIKADVQKTAGWSINRIH